MNIAIIGSGNMANGIGTRIVAGKHSLTIYDRNKEKALALAKKLGVNGKELGEEITEDIIILALPYPAIQEVLKEYKEKLAGKVLVDISNPVNFETFELIPPADSSGTQEISKNLPNGAKLIKAFNTTFAGTLAIGKVDGKPLDVFMAGDDENAKKLLAKVIEDGGARPIDVGDLKQARILEEVGLFHMKLQSQLGNTWMTALKILS